jgi:nitrogen fixation NifU-like protein
MGPSELDELYRDEVILDHGRNPRNPEALDGADITADGVNPFCGDEIHLQISIDDQGRVSRVGFQGAGCAINQAAGSMLSEAVRGMTLDEVGAISQAFRHMLDGQGQPTRDQLSDLGDLASLAGVRVFPVRIKCALLAWATLEDGIVDYRRREGDS